MCLDRWGYGHASEEQRVTFHRSKMSQNQMAVTVTLPRYAVPEATNHSADFSGYDKMDLEFEEIP